MKDLSSLSTMVLASVELYDYIYSLRTSSNPTSGTPSISSGETQTLYALQEINNHFVCSGINISDLTGVVTNIAALNLFPYSYFNSDDVSTNNDPSIDSIKSLLAFNSKFQDFWFSQG